MKTLPFFTQIMIFSPNISFLMKKVPFDDFFMTTRERTKTEKGTTNSAPVLASAEFSLNWFIWGLFLKYLCQWCLLVIFTFVARLRTLSGLISMFLWTFWILISPIFHDFFCEWNLSTIFARKIAKGYFPNLLETWLLHQIFFFFFELKTSNFGYLLIFHFL